jgi:putative oxidoreductase
MSIVLWILQVLLALLFAAAGISKLRLSQTALAQSAPELSTLPLLFIRFIGVTELLAAIGLIVPAATRIAPALTAAAAAGLVLLMTSASVFNAAHRKYAQIGLTVLLLLLAAVVVYGRLVLAPIAG